MVKGVRNVRTRQIEQDQLQTLIDKETGITKLIIILEGKYGMREGEVKHLRDTWFHIDEKDKSPYIDIPPSGALCDCEKCTLQGYYELKRDKYKKKYGHKPNKAWYLKIEKRFYKLRRVGRKFKEHRWSPKSSAGERKIPLLFTEYNAFIKEFFVEHEKIDLTRQAINKRVYRAGVVHLGKENKPKEHIENGLSSHPLRSTAAQFFADNGMSPISLCTIMGWKDLSVADVYIRPNSFKMENEFKDIMNKINNQ